MATINKHLGGLEEVCSRVKTVTERMRGLQLDCYEYMCLQYLLLLNPGKLPASPVEPKDRSVNRTHRDCADRGSWLNYCHTDFWLSLLFPSTNSQ